MAQEGKIGLTIDRNKIWKKLSKLKIDGDFRTFDELLKKLILCWEKNNGEY